MKSAYELVIAWADDHNPISEQAEIDLIEMLQAYGAQVREAAAKTVEEWNFPRMSINDQLGTRPFVAKRDIVEAIRRLELP